MSTLPNIFNYSLKIDRQVRKITKKIYYCNCCNSTNHFKNLYSNIIQNKSNYKNRDYHLECGCSYCQSNKYDCICHNIRLKPKTPTSYQNKLVQPQYLSNYISNPINIKKQIP